jgi:hypothetical protein
VQKQSSYFLIMFFGIMEFLKMLFIIMDPNLHPSFGGGSLAIRCEGKVIIKLPPQNGWANGMG